MRILVVEDDLTLSAGVCFELDCNGYLSVAVCLSNENVSKRAPKK